MRIVFLNPTGELGGAEVSLLSILASLRVAEPRWSLRLIVGSNGRFVSQAEALGACTRVVPFPPALARLGDAGSCDPGDRRLSRLAAGLFTAAPGVLAYIGQLRSALRELNPDLVHTNGLKMHVLGVWSRPPRIPTVWHIHEYVQPRPIMARLLRRCAASCSAVVANSRSVAADVQAACGHRIKVHTVYNAIDLARFCPIGPTLDLDALAGLPPPRAGAVRVGLVGTLASWKGHKTFLEALALLPPNLPIQAYVVGGAVYQTNGSQYSLDELRSLAAKLKISHKVGFTGFVEDSASAMRSLDIVVHASIRPEPFGLVIVEAMACGRALIASQAGGAAEILELGKNALGHPSGDAAALADRIAELASNPGLRAQLGKAGRATAESRFDRARLAEDWIPIYRQVMAS